MAPVIEQVVTDNQDCNRVRVHVFAADVGSGLHRNAYSFDGGQTWQADKYKDFIGLDFKLEAQKIFAEARKPCEGSSAEYRDP